MDLPEPLAPTIATVSPARTVRSKPSSTSRPPSSWWKWTSSKRISLLTGPASTASGASTMWVGVSRMSSRRSPPARACWAIAIAVATIRTGETICSRYDENARNVPREMCPFIASQPPTASTATCPTTGIDDRVGVYSAWMRTSRVRDRYRSSDAAARWRSSRRSCPKPLTTRTPVTASSTTPATSPARCWASHVAGNTALRIFSPVISSSGTIARAISVSVGERNAMTISETTSSTTLPSRIGRIDRTPSIMPDVRRGAGHDLSGVHPVVGGEVEPLQALVHRGAQVVADVDRHPPAERPAGPGEDEGDEAGGDEQGDQRGDAARRADERVVDDDLLDHRCRARRRPGRRRRRRRR